MRKPESARKRSTPSQVEIRTLVRMVMKSEGWVLVRSRWLATVSRTANPRIPSSGRTCEKPPGSERASAEVGAARGAPVAGSPGNRCLVAASIGEVYTGRLDGHDSKLQAPRFVG